ncbi:MAG TPA: GAF domain-containing protein [Pyrinomonadaceae bacterium]|nr:GAF domain-containing protein [Pyrinomonadaceae bacterium]
MGTPQSPASTALHNTGAENGLSDERDRLRLLLDVNNAITSNLNLQGLLEAISTSLRKVIPHDFTGLATYDEQIGQLRVHALESFGPDQMFQSGQPIPLEGNPAGLAFIERKSVLRDRIDHAEFPSPVFRQFCDGLGLRSGVTVPLVLNNRAIGVVSISSVKEAAFIQRDVDLLEQIADQIAIAVENALNFQRAELERDRRQILLEVNNAVSRHLNLDQLLAAISESVRRVIPHDYAGLALYDADTEQLRLHSLGLPGTERAIGEGTVIPLAGTPTGLAFTSRRLVLRDRVDYDEFFDPITRQVNEALNLRSNISVPLILEARVLGVITIRSVQEGAFSAEDAVLLQQIGDQVAIAVENAINFRQAEHERDRRRLLLEVSNAVTSNLSLRDLLITVSACLKRFFSHDFASMVLVDEKTGQLRIHALDNPSPPGLLGEGSLLPIDGTPAGLCIKTRQTIVRPTLDLEEFYAPAVKQAYAFGVRSGCSAPLISHDKVLGSLNVGSLKESTFSWEDAELLTQIADQIAIAVENGLNFERAARERQRIETLLKVNNAITTNLELGDLLKATSESLRDFFKHDFAGLALFDQETNQLLVHALDLNQPDKYLIEGNHIPIEGTLTGMAFSTRQSVVRNRINFDESAWQHARPFFEEHKLKSFVSLPLISRGQSVGVLNLGSRTEDAFDNACVELLEHIATQVAIAVENAVNFGIAARERDRTQLLLAVNNATTSHLDLREVLRATSDSLEAVIPHDAAGIALHDPETNQLRVHILDAAPEIQSVEEGYLMPLNETPAARSFRTGKPVLIHDLAASEYKSPIIQRAIASGFKSSLNVPLICQNKVLGAVFIGSKKLSAFSEADAQLFLNVGGQLAIAVANAMSYREIEKLKQKLVSEKLYLEEEIKTQYNFAEIVGQSPALRQVLKQVETVAPTDSCVLICGETGTGKELIARAIHSASGRRERTLVKLNCAAIPTGLLESELFGHEKGAFTGAISQRIGRFELANKGSLLLDEVGEIPLDLQPKLLRVLQEHEFERLGNSRTIKTDARLIAATNVDLPQMVAEKKFRSDLFYRLNVFPITIPPLRDRTGDIPLLVGYFAKKHALRMNRHIDTVPRETVEALSEYSWPGNVRELENFIERAVILSQGAELQAPLGELRVLEKSFPETQVTAPSAATSAAKPISLEEVERAHIEEVLRQVRGVIGGKGGAAEILGLPSSTLRNRMKKLGLK